MRALADVRAAEKARLNGDPSGWRLVAPGFVFVHSTGAVDDREAFLAFAGDKIGQAGRPTLHEAEAPIVRLDRDVLVTARLIGDPAPPTHRAHRSRLLDVYVWRRGAWRWLAHQTSEVSPRWVPTPVDPATLQGFAGAYEGSDGTLRVFAQRGPDLVFVAPSGERSLVPLSDATFGYPGLVATVTFVRNQAGTVIAADESAQVGFQRFVRVSSDHEP